MTRASMALWPAATFTILTFTFSLVVFAYERALVPLYGSAPTNYLLGAVLLSVMLIAAIQPFNLTRRRSLLCSAIALSIAPKATYWVGVMTSRRKQLVLGPVITHTLVLGPLTFALTALLVETSARRGSVFRRLGIALVFWWSVLQLFRRLWPRIVLLNRISDSQIHLALASIAYSALILSPPTPVPRKIQKKSIYDTKLMIPIAVLGFWFALPMLTSPILPHPLPAPYTNPHYPLRILSAEQSVTGLIVVAEALPRETDAEVHSMRYLRASHSIIGGVWLYDKVYILDGHQPVLDSFGAPLGDSIYAAFVLQEAVRLVDTTRKTKEGLIIGLGAGISATAFNRHGISTTIVEIDPAVYNAARRYFGVPDPGPGRVFLEDARDWVSRREKTGALFDFVVHDCFSGGGVPEHIYTLEFWNDLNTLVEPEGTVVVNYAGIVKSESSRLILYTLLKAFGQCRAFHESVGSIDKYETEFANMVIFCSRSRSPLTFRKARDSDYLGSPLRRHVLGSLADREIDIGRIVDEAGESKYILRDGDHRLGKLQEAQGQEHWKVMREVLSDVHWETY
ncbi:spermidine synthase [Amanita rubescens]|nr:spermidine synthase [Amanita rubescens]